MTSLPRAVWIWTAPPPEGRRMMVWVDADGDQIEVDIDVSDLTPPDHAELEFVAIAVTLAALLAQCMA